MSHEIAYQLALRFFKAGKAGEQMPVVDDKRFESALTRAYADGKRCAHES